MNKPWQKLTSLTSQGAVAIAHITSFKCPVTHDDAKLRLSFLNRSHRALAANKNGSLFSVMYLRQLPMF